MRRACVGEAGAQRKRPRGLSGYLHALSATRLGCAGRAAAGRARSLWLWTTNAHLSVAFGVIDSWGFEYKTLLTWVKDRMGTGEWLRGQTEHCLLAARGKPVFLHGNRGTVLEAARREHSRKPEEFYALVEETCRGSKVELFGRQERKGWQVFGNQTNLFPNTR